MQVTGEPGGEMLPGSSRGRGSPRIRRDGARTTWRDSLVRFAFSLHYGRTMDELPSGLQAAFLGRFTVERELGRGGMAIVLLARDERSGRRVALKVMRPDLAADIAGERFVREIQVSATLDHPHIVPLYESGDAHGVLYYVMPFVQGESLRARLEREGRLPLEAALRIAREIADALQYAHERGVVHRDVKPENILLSGQHARVADFGIARAVAEAGGMRLTDPGIAIGTPEYMSPEQWLADPATDGRTDIYALGCTLYEMLAGHPPFTASTPQAVMLRHATEPAPSVRNALPEVPYSVAQAIERALAKAPADRFPTAAAFADMLGSPEPRQRLGRSGRGALAGAIAALVAITAIVAWRRSSPAIDHPASIAVAPLRNLGDASDAYFADGLAQQLTSALTRVRGIAPRPYSSVASAAKRFSDPLALGRALRVDYVLAATLRRQGERLRITSELIRVEDGSAVWAPQSYDGMGVDVFRMQDSITVQLVRELGGRFAQGVAASRSGRGRGDPEAYSLYLEAMNTPSISAPGSQRAVALLERAVAIDPEFADAWAALAGAYGSWSQYSGEAPSELVRRISDATNRALLLDSLNPSAWAERASLSMRRLDFESALSEGQRALELAPGSAWAHSWYGKLLSVLADDDSAIVYAREAAELDPNDSHYRMILGHLHMRSREFAAADTALRRAHQLNPQDWVVHVMLGRLALMQGDTAATVRHSMRARELQGPDDPFSLAQLGLAYGTLGRQDAARQVLDTLTVLARKHYVQHAWLSWGRYAAGDRTGALGELESSFNAREGDFLLAMDELYHGLRDEPRYRDLLQRSKLARYWAGRRERWSTPYL
jgi:eukaryotic-like serine/threonine-protein kinase